MPQNPGQESSNDDIIFALDTVGIADANDTRINPSTEEKQDNVITELQTNGVIDTGNGTIANLGNGGIFEGVWIDSTPYSYALVTVHTNQDSATDGLQLQTRVAGSSEIHTHAYSVDANTPNGVHLPVALADEQFRLVYTNGITTTTTFRITTRLSKPPVEAHNHPVDHPFDNNHPVQLGRNVIAGKKPDGTYGNLRLSKDNAAFVHNDPHELPEVSVHMIKATGVTDTITTTAASKGDKTITVGNGGLWAVGNKIKIIDTDNTEYDILTIKAIAGNVLTLDRRLDADHIIGEDVVGYDVNMAIDGSSTNQFFQYTPRAGQKIHIHTINITMSSGTEPSLERFGGIAALTNGVHFRVKNTTGRDYTYWIPLRSNNSFELSGFEYIKETKVLTTWFMHMHLDLVKATNSIIFLDGDEGQSFEIIIQDDLTGLDSMEIKLGIHEEPQ